MPLKNADYYENSDMQNYRGNQIPSMFVPPDPSLLQHYNTVIFDSHGLTTLDGDGNKRRIIELKDNAINMKAFDVEINDVSILVLITDMIKKLSSTMDKFGDALTIDGDGNITVKHKLNVNGDLRAGGNIFDNAPP